jgi:hypothetical protein
MTEERDGIDLLRDVVGEIADSMPQPRRRRNVARRVLWGSVAALLLVALGVAAGLLRPTRSPSGPRLPVEVLALRVRGREAQVRVIDSPTAGSIVIVAVPSEAAARRTGEEVR